VYRFERRTEEKKNIYIVDGVVISVLSTIGLPTHYLTDGLFFGALFLTVIYTRFFFSIDQSE
jgi:hypothetical protein